MAQEWATKMFKTLSHDFGAVARGSKQEFSFTFKNLYEEDIHIAGVQSSCGCTTATISKNTLKTFETSEIITVYNTRSFDGAKSATITVTIDKPFYAEVQLQVSGYIRRDVVFDPGHVAFGTVDEGESAEVVIHVAYAGREDWQIQDVRSANRHLEVELEETVRGGGRVEYDMFVRLKPDAPVGFFHDQLTIITNDTNARTVTLPVEGQIQSSLSVSPAQLFLGIVQPGDTVTKRLVVRGKTPFRIAKATCDDEAVSISMPTDAANTLHVLNVSFKAGETIGPVSRKIVIDTDCRGGSCAVCTVTATVAKAAAVAE
jgi:hypothetical protein